MQKTRCYCLLPAYWTFVCTSELFIYNQTLDYFESQNTEIVALSVDRVWCHIAFSEDRKLDFSLIAAYGPKGAVAKIYGGYDETKGQCKRALYLIYENGIIAWNYLSHIDVNPGMSGIMQALDELNNKQQKD